MSKHPTDEQVREQIEQLEAEERRLRSEERDAAEHEAEEVLAADRDRLEAIKVELDQLWDYLHQRQALRDAGEDPAGAAFRDSDIVERYWG
jgi:hypothetical protein